MNRSNIPLDKLTLPAFAQFDQTWFLLTSGDFSLGKFNTMTISWGSLGTIWNRPFAQVVVRTVRYTYEFMEEYPTFTLCAFSRAYRKALNLLGNSSGRDGDKIAASGLTPTASSVAGAPCFAEASLVLECRKIYWDDLEPAHFLDQSLDNHYPQKDYHRIYFGQVLAASGTSRIIKK